jgi:hypothetical protein
MSHGTRRAQLMQRYAFTITIMQHYWHVTYMATSNRSRRAGLRAPSTSVRVGGGGGQSWRHEARMLRRTHVTRRVLRVLRDGVHLG